MSSPSTRNFIRHMSLVKLNPRPYSCSADSLTTKLSIRNFFNDIDVCHDMKRKKIFFTLNYINEWSIFLPRMLFFSFVYVSGAFNAVSSFSRFMTFKILSQPFLTEHHQDLFLIDYINLLPIRLQQ